ncbi:MAG: hypothetical protein KDK36_13255 [Leptospiraceae bacterium]|nr:hypothetical protein [Leptospiraceae bacterium]
MKRDYLLLIAGITPILFLIYVLRFFQADDRKSNLKEAIKVTEENWTTLNKGEKVLITGKLSNDQPKILENFGFLQEEEKIKQKERSVWTNKKNYTNSVIIDFSHDKKVILSISDGYVLCGSRVKVINWDKKDPKKFRRLGIEVGELVTAYGEIEKLEPFTINTGFSMCAESEKEYSSFVNSTSFSYVLLVLFISVPSLFLIYLGLFRARRD